METLWIREKRKLTGKKGTADRLFFLSELRRGERKIVSLPC